MCCVTPMWEQHVEETADACDATPARPPPFECSEIIGMESAPKSTVEFMAPPNGTKNGKAPAPVETAKVDKKAGEALPPTGGNVLTSLIGSVIVLGIGVGLATPRSSTTPRPRSLP